jgi:hypothetical protein
MYNINIKRHKVVKLLTASFFDDSYDRYSYDSLCEILNVNNADLQIIISELFKNKEVVHCTLLDEQLRGKVKKLTKTNSKGILITDEGINALSNKKYLKVLYDKIFTIIFKRIIPIIFFIVMIIKFLTLDIENIIQSFH